eukprot:TRINITY_DN2805_c0_g2_i2.p1 TRINITY_DN2805_c0_g2~~TRINITY_DN2805_c0_g2_i2.p1  ORF type:complete len:209 (-),score=46.02 TRINITY_DN2805_c0_g2_i2:242-868(-)
MLCGVFFFFFQAEDGIRDVERSRGLGDVYKRQVQMRVCMGKNRWWSAWVSSAATIIGVTFFGVIGLFPALIPSSLNPAWSLTIHNAASSPMTLKIMLTVVCVFVPIVLGYQFWVYRLFAKKMTQNDLDYEEAYQDPLKPKHNAPGHGPARFFVHSNAMSAKYVCMSCRGSRFRKTRFSVPSPCFFAAYGGLCPPFQMSHSQVFLLSVN